MNASDVARAVDAARAIAAGCGLPVEEARVVWNSNKLALRLLPCDAFARVAHEGREVFRLEIELARGLAAFEGCPVAALDPRVEPRVYQHDGFAVTLWTHYGATTSREPSPAEYAGALRELHAGMRGVSVETPHFTDRVAEAQQLASSVEATPALSEVDRALLADRLRSLRRAVVDRGAPEQPLHGEPHPGNLLATESGPRFIDLETCCRGPIEFDLAHVPEAVSDRYPDHDPGLLQDCRGLVLAMVAAWRWDRNDDYPNGRREGHRLLRILREGPPWPTLGAS